MARKKISRTISLTEVKLAEITMVDGSPEVKELPNETVVGDVSISKAQRILGRKYPKATVLEVTPSTDVYEIDVLDFIIYADKVEKKTKEGDNK